PAPRRRPRLRLPLPSEPPLGRVAAAAAGYQPQGPPVRDEAAGDRGVPGRAGAALCPASAGLCAGREVVPVDRRRLHRRPPPQRRAGRGAGPNLRAPGLPRPGPSPGSGTWLKTTNTPSTAALSAVLRRRRRPPASD